MASGTTPTLVALYNPTKFVQARVNFDPLPFTDTFVVRLSVFSSVQRIYQVALVS